MLAVKSYAQDYIDTCRARIDTRLDAYEKLVATAAADPSGRTAVEAFEPGFLADLTLVLDACFVHRTRAVEGKDGNPLNEVRMLCASILQNGGVLAADKTIRYAAERSVLGLAVGDAIALDLAGFRRLCAAYFAELEKRFT